VRLVFERMRMCYSLFSNIPKRRIEGKCCFKALGFARIECVRSSKMLGEVLEKAVVALSSQVGVLI
jgi:hypothetical protein